MKLTTRGQYGALFLDSDGYLIQLPELNAAEPVGKQCREGGWVGGGRERQREGARGKGSAQDRAHAHAREKANPRQTARAKSDA